jgi:solute carrier family 13 (sodium-dependent dicarboxylate transporter), member 2/3/5
VLPADSGLDSRQVGIGMGIFVCIAFLWLTEALPLAATALLVPVLAVISGVMDVKSALAGFAHPLIFLFFGGFALASAMAYQGLDRWIAGRIVAAGKRSFVRVSFLLFGVTALLSMWMSNTATTAMMMPLVLGILAQMHPDGGKSSARNAIFVLLGTAYAASIGGIGTLVGSPPNAIAAQKLGIGFGEWMRFGVPAVLVLLPLMILVLWWTCRPESGEPVEVHREPFVFNWHRIVTLAIFAATAICWIFGAKLGAWLGIGDSMDTVVALAAVLALLYFRVVRWRDIDHGTDWGVLLLFGGGITLSSILGNTGASRFLALEFSALVETWPPILVIGAVIAFVIFLTELSSNTATAALMVPIFFAVGVELDIEPARLVIPLALAASCAFMLPVATPPNAIVFSTGRVPQREMMRVGLILNLVFVLALTLLARLLP